MTGFNSSKNYRSFFIIPSYVPLTAVRRLKNIEIDDIFDEPTDGVQIFFTDPGNEVNYDQVGITFTKRTGSSNSCKGGRITINSNDPVFTSKNFLGANDFGKGSLTLNDESFTRQPEPYDSLYVVWCTISKEWYDYITSVEEQQRLNSFLGNYTEPFNAISNIEGGSGVFGLGWEAFFGWTYRVLDIPEAFLIHPIRTSPPASCAAF